MATDWERLRAMKDEDIDCSDIPEFTEEELKNAEVLWGLPENEDVLLNINKEILNYFRSTGKGYWNRLSFLVNSLLKDYVSKQQAQGAVI